MNGTIVYKKGNKYFTTETIHSGQKYVYGRRILKTGLSKNVVKVWLKGARLRFGQFTSKS